MMIQILLTALLAGLCSAGPVPNEKLIVDSDFYDTRFKIYSSQHDIINLEFPLNAINFGEDNDNDDEDYSNSEFYLFFTEVDLNANGDKDYKGLYVLHNGTAHKLLENGRDSTSTNEETKNVFFAASDGIYRYDVAQNKAEKYGTLDDNFINIIQENGTDETTFYAINDKHEMYKITGEGTKKEKVAGVDNAQQLVMDFENNIYFYDQNKDVYVINAEGVTKFEGLKKNPKYIQLLKPAFVFEDSVPLVLDDQVYLVYANGTSELSDFVIKNKPSGYAMEGTLIHFYAYEKKIYEYNILQIILSGLIDEVKEYFEDNVETMKEVASRSRGTLRQKPKHG
ncbi:uncharacterized protein LOC128681133 [Plodia interpunctella]|uniref:uncharacterized protein LOC128681133 n=1 Tax=Plodia interpunctella TaxID=58824 RepID=UPI0023687F3E|nr:uncharacterized protein LOC128681133 [Plodia interpunctella]